MSATNVYASKSCYVKSSDADVSFLDSSLYAKGETDIKLSFVGFDIPLAIKKQDITAAVINLYGKCVESTGNLGVSLLTHSFNEAEVSYRFQIPSGPIVQTVPFTGSDSLKSVSLFDINALLKGVKLSVDGNAEFVLASTRSASNKPYFALTHAAPAPAIDVLSPSESSLTARNYPIDFFWAHKYSPTGILITNPIQKSAKFRYRAVGGSTVEKIIAGETNGYTLPANTFTTDTSEWQVEITDDNGQVVTSAWTAIGTPVAPGNPTLLYPANTLVVASNDNVFAWKHNFSSPQDAAEISFGDNNFWDTPIAIGSEQSYSAIANSLAWKPILRWRVRTKSAGVWGGWSETQCKFYCAPYAPEIITQSLPNIAEIEYRHYAYLEVEHKYAEVFIDNNQCGILPSTFVSVEMSEYQRYKVPVNAYLDAGTHNVLLRMIDNNGIRGANAVATFEITNTPPATITLSGAQSGQAVNLTWGENAAFTAYYIFRDGVMIAKTTANAYADNFAGMGDHVYKVRGVDGTNYADSNEITVTVTVTGAWITPVDNIDWVSIGLKAGNPYGFSRDASGSVVYNYYDGNTAASILDQKKIGNTFAISELTYAGRKKLEGYINKTVCVKTSRGDVIFGVLDKAGNDIFSNYSDIALSVGEITYTEEISYE